MISHLSGDVFSLGDGFVVIDVGGIGYLVHMTSTAVRELSETPGKVRIFTRLIVREDSLTLFGFLSEQDLEVFQILISVNRVGPQLALSILSQIPAADFARAVYNEDEKRLTRLTGIGPRNAKRLILELKDRMKERIPSLPEAASGISPGVREDVGEALVALGFPSRDAYEAIDLACTKPGQEESKVLLKTALGILKEKKDGAK